MATLDISEKLQGSHEILDAAPRGGKDVNDLLQRKLGLVHRKEDLSR